MWVTFKGMVFFRLMCQYPTGQCSINDIIEGLWGSPSYWLVLLFFSLYLLTRTRYGLEGLGIKSRWGKIFRTYPDRLRRPPSLLYNGYRVYLGGKGGRGVTFTTRPFLVPRLRNSWAIPPLTLWVLLGLLWGSLYPFTYWQSFHQCCWQWLIFIVLASLISE